MNLSDVVADLISHMCGSIEKSSIGNCPNALTRLGDKDNGGNQCTQAPLTIDWSVYIRCLDVLLIRALLRNENRDESILNGRIRWPYFEQLVADQISTILNCFGARINAELLCDIQNVAISSIRPHEGAGSLALSVLSLHKFMFFCNLVRVVTTRLTAEEELRASVTIRVASLLGEITSL